MARTNMATQASPGAAKGRKQTFPFTAPTAASVRLAGEFTQWQQQEINLQKGADGIWRVNLELPPGTHYRRFVVDGQRRDEPERVLRAPKLHGGHSAVRHLI